jgi:hypothetical protein
MNLLMDCPAVQQCGSVRQYERQCVAVRTVVCVQCARQYPAVRLVVYGSACGTVQRSASAAVFGFVQQCTWLCAAVRAAVCGSVWQCVAVSTVVSPQCAQ